MITPVMYEELKNSYEENGYADLSYCVRVLQRAAQISPVDLCGTDGSIRDHLKMGRMLRQCFDGPFAGAPYTFASCAKNCERLRDAGRETDFYELFTTMDRTTHATFEKVLNGQCVSASVLLRSTPHDHAERIWARYLNLSLRGLRDAELVLAPEEHRQEIPKRSPCRTRSEALRTSKPMCLKMFTLKSLKRLYGPKLTGWINHRLTR